MLKTLQEAENNSTGFFVIGWSGRIEMTTKTPKSLSAARDLQKGVARRAIPWKAVDNLLPSQFSRYIVLETKKAKWRNKNK